MLDVSVENSKFSKPNFLSATTKLVFVRVLGSKNKLATYICFFSLYSSSRTIFFNFYSFYTFFYLFFFVIFNSSFTSSIFKSSVEIKCFINMHPFLYKKTLCLRSQRDDALIKLPLTFGTF